MANVKIQIVSFSYPTDKILKTSSDFVILSKTIWTKADVSTTHGVSVWKAFFFLVHTCISRLRLGIGGARWLSGRVSDSGARGPGFETYRHRVVSLSKTLNSPKVLVNYPGSDGSVPI